MKWMVVLACAAAGVVEGGSGSGGPALGGCSVVAGPALMSPWVFAAVVASLVRIRRRRSPVVHEQHPEILAAK